MGLYGLSTFVASCRLPSIGASNWDRRRRQRLTPRTAEEEQARKPAMGTRTQPGGQRWLFLSHPTWLTSEHHLLVSPRESGSRLQTPLPSTAPTSSGDFSSCITYFVLPWLVHHLPCLSPSWPFTSLPKASGLFVTFLQTSLLLLSLISSLHRPSSFLKNYLLILCQWDPFPPVSWSVSKRSFCTKRHLQAASRSLWNSAWALSQRGCRWWKALVALECAFFPVCFH